MIGGGREPLSPRRPYTRTHAPAIMDTGTTARLSKPRGPPTFAAMLAQHHLVHVCPTWTGAAGRGTFVPSPNFSEYVGQPRGLPRLTHHVGVAARRQVERCAPVRSSFAIYHRWTNSLQAPRSSLCTGRNPCPFGYPPGALRCRCTPPGAVHAAALRQGRWRCIPIDRQREDPA